jgi:hypothetical protein
MNFAIKTMRYDNFDKTFKKRHIQTEEEIIQELKEREEYNRKRKEERNSELTYYEDDNDLFYYADSR